MIRQKRVSKIGGMLGPKKKRNNFVEFRTGVSGA
jgi:hypothetical protein